MLLPIFASFSAFVVVLGGVIQMYNELSSVDMLYQTVTKAEIRKRRGIRRLIVHVRKKDILKLIKNNSQIGEHLEVEVESRYMRLFAWIFVTLGTMLGEIFALAASVDGGFALIIVLIQLILFVIAANIISCLTKKLDNHYRRYYEVTLGIKVRGNHQEG